MTVSIWRYSHLLLAISSSVFILLATLTGLVLAFEPISNQLKPYAVEDAGTLSLSKTIEHLKAEYDEVISIEIDKNDFVIASVVTKKGKNETFYINPFTAKKIGDIIEKAPVFKFATNLHRSLFLKSTGRAIVGFVSFVLLLMAVTGICLIIKRQGGLKYFFSKVIKEDSAPYYHTVIGRLALIPLIIVTITGIYLSLEKFSLLPPDKTISVLKDVDLDEISKKNGVDINLFQSITLNDIKHLEFPFSEDIEDYFVLKLKDKALQVNQYSGAIVSEKKTGWVALVSGWSMMLHTGQGSIFWSVVLLLTCLALLFFIYSGFAMALYRKKNSIKIKNKFNKDSAEYIILIGSETGSTFKFAKTLYDALITQGKSVFVSELNSYTHYKQAKHLVVFTSTYGNGEAPVNATHFEKLVHIVSQSNTLQYSVVGFGSLAYKSYCQYAIIVDALLQMHHKFVPDLKLHKIHNQSFDAFKSWIKNWEKSKGLNLQVKNSVQVLNSKPLKLFRVVSRSEINTDNSFLVALEPAQKVKFTSGDLLSVFPKEDPVERLYSIGKVHNNILLSIKKHEFGVCSKYLNELKIGDMILADIKPNSHFHFPASAKEVIMIANGTGLAPFLGMINNETIHHTKTYLFWGGRTKASYQMYSKLIDKAFYERKLSGIYLSFSREESQKKYVQNALAEKEDLITRVLQNNGIIMICGSLAMQKGVKETLGSISVSKLGIPLNMNQIKSDCY
ncbi:PepSY domain-containing protein [Tamlana sp. 2201CG12-4]|uniref:PepSY domain-containing protein n=1 Tax=Tamlana sp. 2201CG12-4 TaxID=3112582 RepID=UPI002DB5A309|nr:PepSY domain-containing protein [Tamlana sp. 2201CG12-4]MEC3906162.1 PepSY domain-containing protein [Tamlana sp. 2201CG12-4]